MKRDPNLIRTIVLLVESDEWAKRHGLRVPEIGGYTCEQVGEHVRLAMNDRIELPSLNKPDEVFFRAKSERWKPSQSIAPICLWQSMLQKITADDLKMDDRHQHSVSRGLHAHDPWSTRRRS